MSAEPIRIRPWLLVSVAIFSPLMSSTTEFRALATAIMIPKIHETNARIAKPMKTSAIRSFRSFGRRRGGVPPGGLGGTVETGRLGPPPFDPSPFAPFVPGRVATRLGSPSPGCPFVARRDRVVLARDGSLRRPGSLIQGGMRSRLNHPHLWDSRRRANEADPGPPLTITEGKGGKQVRRGSGSV